MRCAPGKFHYRPGMLGRYCTRCRRHSSVGPRLRKFHYRPGMPGMLGRYCTRCCRHPWVGPRLRWVPRYSAQPLPNSAPLSAQPTTGFIVGYERESKEKPAGVRTLVLVSLGSMLFTANSFIFTSTTGGPNVCPPCFFHPSLSPLSFPAGRPQPSPCDQLFSTKTNFDT